jgi:hypothetical protein
MEDAASPRSAGQPIACPSKVKRSGLRMIPLNFPLDVVPPNRLF